MFLPQMSPMWWTLLMMTFILSYIMYMNIMYFNYKKIIKASSKMEKTMKWLW